VVGTIGENTSEVEFIVMFPVIILQAFYTTSSEIGLNVELRI